MASIQEAIRRLTIQATTPGVAESEAALNRLAVAQGGVAVASQNTERASLSLDQKFAQLERRYVSQVRASQDYEKTQRAVNQAVAQNPALQDRANALLAAAAEKHGQVTGIQKAMATASQSLNLQVAALASNLGLTGQVLSAFGPWGFAAAVGLGAVEAGISLLSDKAHELASKAKEIKEFSEATGLTTMQFQATRSEMGKFGIDAETMASGISKFTAGFADLRNGQGDLLTQVRRVNPALADQMQRATDTATAFTLFGKAVSETDNIFQRNALLKAGMGKGASVYGAFFEAKPDVAALTSAFAAAGKGIDDNLIKKLAQLEIDIHKTRSAANTVFATMFGTSTLENELEFQKGLLVIAQTLKEFTLSEDLKKFIDWITSPATLLALGAIATGAAILSGGTLLAIGGVGLAGAGVYGASRDSIRSAGRAANDNSGGPSPIPAAPNFNATFDAVGKSNAATGARTALADIADMEKRISMLGSAATATEKYEAAIAKLKVGQDGLTLSGEQLSRAQEGLRLDRDAAIISNKIGALGAAAGVTDLLAQKENQLQKAQLLGARLTDTQVANARRLVIEQANGVGAVNSQIDALSVQQKTIGMSVGAAAEYTAVQTKINEAIRNGNPLNAEQEAGLRKVAAALREKAQSAANDNELARVDFDRQTIFLTDLEKQIASVNRQLHGNDWKHYTDDALSNSIRLTSGLKDTVAGFNEVGKAAFSAALSGANGAHALVGALDSVAKKLADKGFENLLSGALSGDPMQMAAGLVQAGASALISVFTRDQKNSETLKKAQAEWAVAGPAFQAFLKQMGGGQQGAISKSIADASAQEAQFEKQAWEARDTAAIVAARAGLQKFSDTQKRQFSLIFDSIARGYETGSGPDSAFLKSVNSVKSALESTLGFIDDAKETFGNAAKGENGAAAARATAAAQTYLLALLKTPEPLSQVQQGLQAVQGTASALQNALTQLGMSSADAATAINAGVAKAVANLKTQFEAGLTERLNTANGKSYLNDATRLIQQHQQDMVDAASLGTDPALVSRLYRVEAQKIVNDAGLVGDAFSAFTRQFPQLADVVTQATKEVGAGIADFRSGLTSRLNVATGSNFLNDAATLLQQHQQDLADAARFGNDPALMTQIATLFAAEAQKIVNGAGLVGEAFDAFTTQFPDLAGIVVDASADISDAQRQLQDSLNSSAKSIIDYVTGITAGSSSTLSPQDRFNAAQATYNTKLALSLSSDAATRAAAQATITQDFENYRQAARDMFGSSVAYQQIVTTGISQLLNLPAVQQATDPVVVEMRNVLAAINAGNAAQATDATLQGVIKAAIDAGNAAQIAALLIPKFDALNTTSAGGLNFTQFVSGLGPAYANVATGVAVGSLLTQSQLTALGLSRDTTTGALLTNAQLQAAGLAANSTVSGLLTQSQLTALGLSSNATVAQVRDAVGTMDTGNLLRVFQELDGNGNGILEKSELIRIASQGTQSSTASTVTNTGNTAGNTGLTIARIDTANNLQDSANSLATSANNLLDAQRILLDAIKSLQDTGTTQLGLIRTALNTTGVSVNVPLPAAAPSGIPGLAAGTTNVPIQNQMVAALNKIVWNTFVIANNTNYGPRTPESLNGTFAAGGWITGGIPGIDSVRILAQRDEFVVNPLATRALTRNYGAGIMDMINAGLLPQRIGNDNSRFSASNVVDFAAARVAARPTDNGQHFAVLAERLIGAMAGISMTEMNAMKEENAKLRAMVADLTVAVRGNKPAPARPNQRTGTSG